MRLTDPMGLERKNRMKIAKISSYDQRMHDYRQERRDFWMKDAIGYSLFAALFYGAVCYTAHKYGFPLIFDMSWPVGALAIWMATIPPVIRWMHPERPTRSDVVADQLFRRAHGLDDTVDES